jgi:hypothetical protein
MRSDVHVTLFPRRSTRRDDTAPVEPKEIDWDAMAQKAAIAQETADTVVKSIAIAYVVKKLVDTTCQIAIIAAKAKLK